MTTTATHRETIDDDQFAALCNLFHATHCDHIDLTPAQAGDILYYDASPMVCDHSRTIARAVMAYLGLRFAGGQPRRQPGSGCRFADVHGNCDFHDIRHANELVDMVQAEMLSGKGSLPDDED